MRMKGVLSLSAVPIAVLHRAPRRVEGPYPVIQGCFGVPEVFGDLRDRSFGLPCNRDHVTSELASIFHDAR